jgi:hypothetical protein
MKFRAALLASLILFTAQAALADATFTASATSNGGPLTALSVGDVVTIDVTIRSDGIAPAGDVFGLGVSAVGYDTAVATFTSGSLPTNVLNQICVAPGSCFAGLANTTGSAFETTANSPGLPEVQLFNGVSTVAVSGTTGEVDQGVITGVAGDAQFQVVFTAAGDGTTTITLGANTEYGDDVVGTGGVVLGTTNVDVVLTVPEPATMASSLAALGSVLGVVAIRRRA